MRHFEAAALSAHYCLHIILVWDVVLRCQGWQEGAFVEDPLEGFDAIVITLNPPD
jgi:hypothetical protein